MLGIIQPASQPIIAATKLYRKVQQLVSEPAPDLAVTAGRCSAFPPPCKEVVVFAKQTWAEGVQMNKLDAGSDPTTYGA